MKPPECAADLRLVPHFISPFCDECGARLVLADYDKSPDEIWWDEWVCLEHNGGVHMDWPASRVEERVQSGGRSSQGAPILAPTAAGPSIPWEQVKAELDKEGK